MNPEATCVLKKMRADVWNIVNNHIMDAGSAGLFSTLKIAQEMGCQTIGAGADEISASNPIYFKEAGGIGLFLPAFSLSVSPQPITPPVYCVGIIWI